MKIVNTYKQYDITWFNYKHLFHLGRKLTIHKTYPESKLMSWLECPNLKISMRKPCETN